MHTRKQNNFNLFLLNDIYEKIMKRITSSVQVQERIALGRAYLTQTQSQSAYEVF